MSHDHILPTQVPHTRSTCSWTFAGAQSRCLTHTVAIADAAKAESRCPTHAPRARQLPQGPKPMLHSHCSQHCRRQGPESLPHTRKEGGLSIVTRSHLVLTVNEGRTLDWDVFSPCARHEWSEDFRLGRVLTLFSP